MISVKEMLEIERRTVENGVPISVLMENAGKRIAEILKERFELADKKILIVCYHGNNGGDGFAAAYFLKDNKADVLFLGNEEKLGEEAKHFYELVKENLVPDADFNDYDIVIDAVLGTGTKGEIKEPLSSAIDKINGSRAFKVSIDVPTGIDPDTGDVLDKTVNPDLVICFYDIKKGLKNIKDKCITVDIGFKI